MNFLTFLAGPAAVARTPAPPVMPVMDAVQVALQYRGPSNTGDYFDALVTSSAHLVFLLLDAAGQRAGAQDLTALVQAEFRSRSLELFSGAENRAEALSELCLHLNRTILEATGRAHLTTAFLGAFDSQYGILSYINASHVPGLLLAPDANEFLESTGLPLGLFSHATHEACYRVIPRGGALLMASRGVIEARSGSVAAGCLGHGHEFGSAGVLRATAGVSRVAQSLCRAVLDAAAGHTGRHMDEMSVAALSRDP